MDAKHILVFGLMLATLLVLITGVGVMMIGGRLNEKYSGRLMVMRVSLQALTLLCIGAILLLGGK